MVGWCEKWGHLMTHESFEVFNVSCIYFKQSSLQCHCVSYFGSFQTCSMQIDVLHPYSDGVLGSDKTRPPGWWWHRKHSEPRINEVLPFSGRFTRGLLMFCECLVSLIGLLHVSAEGNNALGNLLLAVGSSKHLWKTSVVFTPCLGCVLCQEKLACRIQSSAGNEHDQHVSHQLAMGPPRWTGGLETFWTTLWLCQNSYWQWWFIVDLSLEHGDFP